MNDESRHQLAERFVELVEYLNREMHSGPREEWGGIDLTIPQVKALAVLQRGESMRMGEIARELSSTLSATSTIVDRLVNKNLVARRSHPADRRVVECELTAQGHKAMVEFWRIGRLRITPLLERMDSEQLAIVVRGLELLSRKVKEVQEHPA